MSSERMLDGESKPSNDDMLEWIGKKATLWTDLEEYISNHYDHERQLVFGGKKYGWAIRYRKSGRTLVTLYPERNGFTCLLVLGKKEVAKVELIIGELSANIKRVFEETPQLHDGRWLWIRPSSERDMESIKRILSIKRRPKPKT